MRRFATSLASGLILAAWVAPVAAQTPQEAEGVAFFESKIRPVLIEHCYQCHSAQAQANKKLKGGLLVDTRDGLRKGGDSGPALVPGKPDDSLLIKALRYEATKMPPKGKLPNDVVADITRWVQMGAPDPREGTPLVSKRAIDIEAAKMSWAFRAISSVPPPPVKQSEWARTLIDRFILAKLEEKQLAPATRASKEKLLRRAYFDLVGLPPAAADLEAFVNDPAPDAYERLVDRLLQSEHYGERWGRHWLDVVRFAESGGYEFDANRPGAYHYRDFVIKAFNQDMPYDQFVRLQLAGDHLQPGDFFATSATGFLVAGPYPGQTTAKTIQLIRYDHLDDMVATLGTSMLGLSLGCARCHEHKYDPIPQQDYYHLLACLSRTDSVEAKLDPNPEIYRKAKAEFDLAHAPIVAVQDKFEREELPGRLQQWLQAEQGKPAPTWLTLDATVPPAKTNVKGRDNKPTRGNNYQITAHTLQKSITAFRLEIPREAGSEAKDALQAQLSVTVVPLTNKAAKPTPVRLKTAQITLAPDKPAVAVFEIEGTVSFDGGTVVNFTLKLDPDRLKDLHPRLAISAAPLPVANDAPAEPQAAQELLASLDPHAGQLNAKNRDEVVHWFRKLDTRTSQVYDAVDQHLKQQPQPKVLGVFSATSNRGGDVHYLIRGEVDRKNGVARPAFLQVLMSTPEREKHWLTADPSPAVAPRVALANWLTDNRAGAGNLLARVLVNRLWQHHFGKGLVRTPNDFGAQGEAPSHPELLDWLAGEFIRGGWRMKPLHKLLMTSAAYQQGGEASAAALQADPQNRLWGRIPARRLEAEVIRDALLAASGALDPTMYGPGTLDGNGPRRSIYLTVKRSQPVPMMQTFDAPEAVQSIGERQTTTVATQALALLNSPFVRQRAEKLAQRVRPKTPDDLPQTVEQAYLTTLSRKPGEDEKQRMLNFIQQQATSHGPGTKGLDLAVTDFCQVLLCLNEFVYLD